MPLESPDSRCHRRDQNSKASYVLDPWGTDACLPVHKAICGAAVSRGTPKAGRKTNPTTHNRPNASPTERPCQRTISPTATTAHQRRHCAPHYAIVTPSTNPARYRTTVPHRMDCTPPLPQTIHHARWRPHHYRRPRIARCRFDDHTHWPVAGNPGQPANPQNAATRRAGSTTHASARRVPGARCPDVEGGGKTQR